MIIRRRLGVASLSGLVPSRWPQLRTLRRDGMLQATAPEARSTEIRDHVRTTANTGVVGVSVNSPQSAPTASPFDTSDVEAPPQTEGLTATPSYRQAPFAELHIPCLKDFLGRGQLPQVGRFGSDDMWIYDNKERIAARAKLRNSIVMGADNSHKVGFRGLGGVGKSHNLLRFVAEQRAAGDCVVYIHTCADLRESPRRVVAGALVNALEAFDPAGTNAEAARLRTKLLGWGRKIPAPWRHDRVSALSMIKRARAVVAAQQKNFLVVMDQENRLWSPALMPTVELKWARGFVKAVEGNLVVVSASDNNEGHEKRGWEHVIVQAPSPMPEEFALKLLREAAGNHYPMCFSPESQEFNILKLQIEHYNGGFAPMEVGHICDHFREVNASTNHDNTAFPSAAEVCRAALDRCRSLVVRDHTEFYAPFLNNNESKDVFLNVAISWFSGVVSQQFRYDRRFCSISTTGQMIFASPLVKRAMFSVLRAQCFSHHQLPSQILPRRPMPRQQQPPEQDGCET